MEIGDRFVIAALRSVRQEGYQSREDVSDEIEGILIRQLKAEIIAARLQERIEAGEELYSIANSLNTNVEQAANISFTSFSVPVAGIEPRLIGTATTIDENRLSGPVIGENGVYLLEVTSISIPEEKDLEMEKNRLGNSIRARVNFDVFEALREQANVKDNRHQFY